MFAKAVCHQRQRYEISVDSFFPFFKQFFCLIFSKKDFFTKNMSYFFNFGFNFFLLKIFYSMGLFLFAEKVFST